MKIPFDIEKAKAGARVVTRGGLPVTIFSYNGNFPINRNILAVMSRNDSDIAYYCNSNGMVTLGNERADDLFLEVEPEYKPFDLSNAPVGRIVKSKTSGSKFMISSATNTVMGVGMSLFLYENFLKEYVFEDSSPCGVLVS